MIRGGRWPDTTTRKYTLPPKYPYPWCCIFVLSFIYYAWFNWEEFVSIILRPGCTFKTSNETNKGSFPLKKEENTTVNCSAHLNTMFMVCNLIYFQIYRVKNTQNINLIVMKSIEDLTFIAVVALDVIDIFILIECV